MCYDPIIKLVPLREKSTKEIGGICKMARGKRLGLQDKVAKIDAQIEAQKDKIKAIKAKITALEKQKEDMIAKSVAEEFAEINDLIKVSGKSPEEIKRFLQG